MKLVIDARESGTTTGRHIDKLIEYLHKLKPVIDIVILTKTPRIDFFHSISPNFTVEKADYKEFTLSEQLSLGHKLYSLKPDLVHFTMTNQPILYFGKTVTTIHALTTARFMNPAKNPVIFKFKQCVYRGVILWVAHKSKSVFTISNYVKEDLVNFTHVKPAKIVVTYLAADKITDSPQSVSTLIDRKFLMYVGRPLPHKNLGRLIDAFEVLQKKWPDLWLVLAGKKDVLYQRHEREIRKRGINNVLFTGFVSEGQLRWLYEKTAAYIFPSLSEGFGLPGLEAMRHGAPVVSSSATCLPEIYQGAAQYFDPLSVDEMAVKIDEVLTNAKLREDLIKKGRLQVKKYSWEKMAAQTLEIYTKILKT